MRKLVILIPAILVFLSLTASVALAQDPANGKTDWEKQVWQCSKCHGPNGEGMYGPPLVSSTLTEAEWINQVRHPRRFMPTFSETQVSDQQIKDIHAYITSLPKPTGEFKRKDPGINATTPGQKLMIQKNCVACHEEAIAQGTGLGVDSFVKRGATPTTDAVIKQLRTPFKNMPSYSEAQVSNDEAAQIADYLNSAVAKQAAAAPATTPAPAATSAPVSTPAPATTPVPANLPATGGDAPTNNLPLMLLLVGGGLVLVGLTLRRLIVKH